MENMQERPPIKLFELAKPRFHPAYRILLIGAATLVACLALAILLSDKFIFPVPVSGLKPDADMIQLQVAPEVSITLRYHKNPAAEYTILYSHGNGDSLNSIKGRLKAFVDHGYNVVAYDYEGYGASQGVPSEPNCKRDIAAVYSWLTGPMKIPAEKIIIYGFSVGTGPSCWLATREPAAGLVLEAPYLSTFLVVCAFPLPGDKFRNYECMEKITMPVLIYHGTDDAVIPFRHGKSLYERCRSARKRFAPSDAGHLNVADAMGADYWQEMTRFFPRAATAK